MPIEIVLKSVITALEKMHVLGMDSELHAGAVKALKNVIKAIEDAKKEAGNNEDHDGQREDD